MIPDHLLEEAAVHYLMAMGANPLLYATEIGLQPIRIRKIMAAKQPIIEGFFSAPKEPERPRRPTHVRRPSSTWRSKTVAGIAMLAALGISVPTIAKMIKRPEVEVKAVVDQNQKKIDRLQTVGRERRNQPVSYPLRDRQQIGQTQEQLWLTRILFSEAANQPLIAKEAVAGVILNRVKSKRYPNSIMGVILQARQFSGYNSRLWKISEKPDDMNIINKRAYLQCADVANRAVKGKLQNPIGGATLYHDNSISLPWVASKVKKIADIGNFSFYEEIR